MVLPERRRPTASVAGKALQTDRLSPGAGPAMRPWVPLMIDQAAARSPALISVGQSPFAIYALFVFFTNSGRKSVATSRDRLPGASPSGESDRPRRPGRHGLARATLIVERTSVSSSR